MPLWSPGKRVRGLEAPRISPHSYRMAKMLKVHSNVITRILKDLSLRRLVEFHELQGRNKTFRLTKRGDLARQVLDNLVEPKR